MDFRIHRRPKAGALAPGCAVALLIGVASQVSYAQQAAAPRPASAPAPAPAGTGWYGYVPGQGWVRYVPPSTPAVSPGAAGARSASSYAGATTPPAAGTAPAPGWAGYNPGPAWMGYAPASAGVRPAVRPAPSWGALPADGSRRRAANRFVNGNAPALSYTLPAYREYGTGRNIPLAKPWLPASP